MEHSYRPMLIHGPAPEPLELYWMTAAPPDGLYVVPPDTAALPEGQGELLLVGTIALAVGLLAVLLVFTIALS